MLFHSDKTEADYQARLERQRIEENHENAARVVLSRIMDATGAKSEFEALTATRALANAMNEIMTLIGAQDTTRAVELVADMVLIVKEQAARKQEIDDLAMAAGFPRSYISQYSERRHGHA